MSGNANPPPKALICFRARDHAHGHESGHEDRLVNNQHDEAAKRWRRLTSASTSSELDGGGNQKPQVRTDRGQYPEEEVMARGRDEGRNVSSRNSSFCKCTTLIDSP